MARLTTKSRSVAGKVVVVTGAASGMGRATAQLFADEGAKVAVTDRTAELVAPVVDEITAAGGTAAGWGLHVSDPVAITKSGAEIADRVGGINVLDTNPRTSSPGP